MQFWRRLAWSEKFFLILAAIYALLYFSGAATAVRSLVGMGAFLIGVLVLFRLARRFLRKAIWRLRNRLVLAYLFIAVVPIVLILGLVAIAAWAVIGQMAVYLV